jgi:hypothetical protein
MVLGCTFRGQDLAIKFVDVVKDDVTAFEREIATYRKLEAFQGQLIPKVMWYHIEVSRREIEICGDLSSAFSISMCSVKGGDDDWLRNATIGSPAT